jgi:hypothetical protein
MGQGREEDVSLVSWHSGKCPRVAKSSLAAEVQAMTEGESELMWCRLQWAEMTGTTIDLRSHWQAVKTVPGTIVIDARSAYDAIYRTVSSHLGLREKNSAVELLALQENLVVGATRVRWVHSLAQLADSMTKPSAREAMDLFLRRHRWCIVWDPNMESAKRRKARGLDRFEASDYRETVHKEAAVIFAESDRQACCWALWRLLR